MMVVATRYTYYPGFCVYSRWQLKEICALCAYTVVGRSIVAEDSMSGLQALDAVRRLGVDVENSKYRLANGRW
jgi:hypothetical protein